MTLISVVTVAILLANWYGDLHRAPDFPAAGENRRSAFACHKLERDLTRKLDIDTSDEVGHNGKSSQPGIRWNAGSAVRGARLFEWRGQRRRTVGGSLRATLQRHAGASFSSQEETSSSLQELSTAVKQNAENARQASQLASGARDAADKGGSVVHSARWQPWRRSTRRPSALPKSSQQSMKSHSRPIC